MIHRFLATFDINGQPQNKMEMQYNDGDIKTTLTRRIKTAFPNATSIQITRIEDPQLTLTDKPRTK